MARQEELLREHSLGPLGVQVAHAERGKWEAGPLPFLVGGGEPGAGARVRHPGGNLGRGGGAQETRDSPVTNF